MNQQKRDWILSLINAIVSGILAALGVAVTK